MVLRPPKEFQIGQCAVNAHVETQIHGLGIQELLPGKLFQQPFIMCLNVNDIGKRPPGRMPEDICMAEV